MARNAVGEGQASDPVTAMVEADLIPGPGPILVLAAAAGGIAVAAMLARDRRQAPGSTLGSMSKFVQFFLSC